MSRWPNLVVAYIAGVRDQLDIDAAIETPATFDQFIRVTKGSGDDDLLYDSVLLDFDVLTGDYLTSVDLAERLRQWVLSTQNTIVGDAHIGQVRTAAGPVEIDWGNPNISRFVYSARITTARQ